MDKKRRDFGGETLGERKEEEEEEEDYLYISMCVAWCCVREGCLNIQKEKKKERKRGRGRGKKKKGVQLLNNQKIILSSWIHPLLLLLLLLLGC